jgi:hypothetical protein
MLAGRGSGHRSDRGRAQWRQAALGVAGDTVVVQRVGESVEVLAVNAVFETRKGGGTRQVLRGVQGKPLHAALQHGGRAGEDWHHCRPHTRKRFGRYAGPRGHGARSRYRMDAAYPVPPRQGAR